MSKNCWPNGASRSTMSASSGGCGAFTPLLAQAARPCRHRVGNRRGDRTRTGIDADGWQGSTVRSILENPRYTGYGRWIKHETLLDPDDVAAGHVIRFRWSKPDRIVRSRQPAHPAIVTVEEFVEVQLLRWSRAAGGLAARRKLERGPKATQRLYPLRGRIRCGYCSRRMEATPRASRTYYRCAARTLVPGSAAFHGHPKNVYLPEAAVLASLNAWLGDLFDPNNIDRTVAALITSQDETRGVPNGREAMKKRLAEAEARLRRFHTAISAGVDPAVGRGGQRGTGATCRRPGRSGQRTRT